MTDIAIDMLPDAAALRWRHIAAVVVGNALEFYDFLTYSFFSVFIAAAFFPTGNPGSSLLLALATFGAGFATRPLGGIVIGALGDRVGRKPAMFLSFSLMGISIVGVALTPSYASIGLAAPLLVIAFRLVQGFALGGDVGPTTAFLIEAPAPAMRGFMGSLQAASQQVAVLSAGIVGLVLASILPHEALAQWGWRAAFLLGASVVPFGLFVRHSLPETKTEDGDVEPLSELLRRHMKVIVLGLAMLGAATIGVYGLGYIPTYAIHTLGMSPRLAFLGTVVIGLFSASGAVLGGWLSDRVGRKPVMLTGFGVLILVIVPGFMVLDALRSEAAMVGLCATYALFHGFGASIVIVTVCESLPRSARSGVGGTIYALAIAALGGTAQPMIAWLTDLTGNHLMPAYYVCAALAAGLIAMFLVPESAPLRST